MNIDLKAKAKAMNTLHKWLNKSVPLLQAELNKGFKLKADNSLFAKDKERFKKIIDSAPYRAHIDFSDYSVWLNADITFKHGECGCIYFKQTVYLFNLSNNKKIEYDKLKVNYTADILRKKNSQIENIKTSIRHREYQLSSLKNELGI